MVVSDETDPDDNCVDLQREELEILESIYPECVSTEVSHDAFEFRLEIPIDLGISHELIIVNEDILDDEEPKLKPLFVTRLPPLLLEVELPPSYPARCAPKITSLHCTHMWLPSLAGMETRLLEMWQPGEGVLFPWVETVRSGDMLKELGVLRGDKLILPHPAPHLLRACLSTYDSHESNAQFAASSQTCAICITAHKGSRCLRLNGCGHVFCRSCLEDFWGLCITEGDVGRVGCPDPECVKAGKEAGYGEICRIVGEDLAQRWMWLQKKRALEKDPSLVHCPMPFCQTAIPKPPVKEGEESAWDRLRVCPSCRYSFCAFCKHTWHGPISHCATSATSALLQSYLDLAEDSPERGVLERRYGRAYIQRLVTQREENLANEAYFAKETMRCPGCSVMVQKSVGCNHMTCAKCGWHFCYRCGAKLNAANPYQHFSTPGLSCFSKLFDYSTQDMEWQPIEGFAAAFG